MFTAMGKRRDGTEQEGRVRQRGVAKAFSGFRYNPALRIQPLPSVRQDSLILQPDRIVCCFSELVSHEICLQVAEFSSLAALLV